MKLMQYLIEGEEVVKPMSYELSPPVNDLAIRVGQLNSKKKYTLATLLLAKFLKSKKHIIILSNIVDIVEQEGYVPDDISRYRSVVLQDLLTKIAPSYITEYEINYLTKLFN